MKSLILYYPSFCAGDGGQAHQGPSRTARTSGGQYYQAVAAVIL